LIIEWTRPALSDLIEAQAYITRENPKAATDVAQSIWDAGQNLADNPEIGRADYSKGSKGMDSSKHSLPDCLPCPFFLSLGLLFIGYTGLPQ